MLVLGVLLKRYYFVGVDKVQRIGGRFPNTEFEHFLHPQEISLHLPSLLVLVSQRVHVQRESSLFVHLHRSIFNDQPRRIYGRCHSPLLIAPLEGINVELSLLKGRCRKSNSG